MYVLIVFNRYDSESIDAVLGPFDTSAQANDKYHELFGHAYRHVSVQKLTKKLPEWSR